MSPQVSLGHWGSTPSPISTKKEPRFWCPQGDLNPMYSILEAAGEEPCSGDPCSGDPCRGLDPSKRENWIPFSFHLSEPSISDASFFFSVPVHLLFCCLNAGYFPSSLPDAPLSDPCSCPIAAATVTTSLVLTVTHIHSFTMLEARNQKQVSVGSDPGVSRAMGSLDLGQGDPSLSLPASGDCRQSLPRDCLLRSPSPGPKGFHLCCVSPLTPLL